MAGVTERLKETVDAFRGKKKEEEEVPMGNRLEKIGLSFLASEETKTRISRKQELLGILYSPLEGTSPEEKINDLYTKVNCINKILHETDIPYGRGGNRGWYSKIIFAWTDIYAISQNVIESTMRQIKKVETIKQSSPENNRADER